MLQPLKDRQVTVLLSAQVRGRKVETRWSFVCDAVPASGVPAHGTAVPAHGTAAPAHGTAVPAPAAVPVPKNLPAGKPAASADGAASPPAVSGGALPPR